MKSIGDERGVESMCKRVLAAAVAGLSFGAMMMAPAIVAAKSGDETRVVSYRAVDRAEIENLQRWVAAGHEDWCKDARLVAAEEFRRLAPDFAAHGICDRRWDADFFGGVSRACRIQGNVGY